MSLFVKDIIQMAEAQLEKCGIINAKLDAELIFRHIFGVDKIGFFKLWGTEVDDGICDLYLDLVALRGSGMPLQYITGEQEFMGFTFQVNPNVLIPRQDTEILVEEAIAIIKSMNKKSCSVLDLGCGSGAVGISIAKMCECARVAASDISEEAIKTARQNAKALNVEKKMSFAAGDWFAPFKKKLGSKKFDLIVANPPYIKSSVIPNLQTEIKDHEPHLALDGGTDGLAHYRSIVPFAHLHLKREGVIALEIGYDQAIAVANIADEFGKFNDLRLIKDLAGRHRVLVLEI
ncbi:MAG: peptide chain release factor N(5)-glutamine methyltransferase [Clostridiales bacterium]|nr:peptide chain release factor N(5)-glutamine methyltransferase [Clostridiales bacterium]